MPQPTPGSTARTQRSQSSRNQLRNLKTKIGELLPDVIEGEKGFEMPYISSQKEHSSPNIGRDSNKRTLSSEDIFWKTSPRTKKIRLLDSSPSKEESIDDVEAIGGEVSVEMEQLDTVNVDNVLNQSIIQSFKQLKESKVRSQKESQKGDLQGLLKEIANSMQDDEDAKENEVLIHSTNITHIESENTNNTVKSSFINNENINVTIRNNTGTIQDDQDEDDVFSDDEPHQTNRQSIRTTTEQTEYGYDDEDSFSDDNFATDLSKFNLTRTVVDTPSSFKLFDENDNRAKCGIDSPLLHRFQIKEIRENQLKIQGKLVSQKILKCLDKNDSICHVLVRNSWANLEFQIGDIIHIVTENPGDRNNIVDENQNLLIWHPDELISATKIGTATSCQREAILNDRINPLGPASEYLIIGNVTHTIFQECLEHRTVDDNFIKTVVKEQLDSYQIQIFGTEKSRQEIEKAIDLNVEYIKQWMEIYVTMPISQTSKLFRKVTDYKVTNVLDIEEKIISPVYGFQGYIDAVIEIWLKQDGGKYIIPMEIKSGGSHISHLAQVASYTTLMKDRYDVNVKFTDLVYTKIKKNQFQEIKRADMRHLIHLRNNLAQYMVYGITKLPPLKMMESCERCFSMTPCMVLNKLVEDGTASGSGIKEEIYEELTTHLNNRPHYTVFFNHWNELITKEEGFSNFTKADLWKYTSKEREENGGNCIGGLKIESFIFSKDESSHAYLFKRDRLIENSRIQKGDSVYISDERGKFGIAMGYVQKIDSNSILIFTNRRWTDNAIQRDDFDPAMNQVFKSVLDEKKIQTQNTQSTQYNGHTPMQTQTQTQSRTVSRIVKERTYRVDRNEFLMGMSRARWNLLNLFMPDGDHKTRDLLVDFRVPKYATEPLFICENLESFNLDQKKAVDLVSKAEDYALILGMPGTGKTTVISKIIELIVKSGKSVLISSHTHSAVDNICEKLTDSNNAISLLRVGAPSKIMKKLHKYTIYSEEFQHKIQTKIDYDELIDNSQVVAVTCLGISDPLLNTGKRYDYCIIDEASQVSLPIVLGPLQFADRFVLVGDHHQLPPLVRHPEAKAQGLDKSLFQILNDAHPKSVIELTNQYRMCQEIMKVSNELIYNGRLKCGSAEVAEQSLFLNTNDLPDKWTRELLNPSKKVIFANYDKLGFKEMNKGDTIENTGEAHLIKELICDMVESNIELDQIGLMSFYNGQLRYFERLLFDMKDKLEMLTADRFQGRDKDVIIISLVRTEVVGDLMKEWRRINVAMTRAKKKLIIFGHLKLLQQEKEFKDFVNLFKEQKWIIDL
ncbi:bifunctional ATP-dependent DNA helicase/ssDNA endodeoxyribonuclease [Martiniozyma asiatica (nom. inval.)]|nr:bifunctional ATP-dependent DNA helicase/ssDNA endodeoxyribonuclease [Martiniozyma asiatica]